MKRPLLVLSVVMGVIVTAALILTLCLEQVQPPPPPSLENRRSIDADPTPPDRPAPTTPPTDPHTAPSPVTPPPR